MEVTIESEEFEYKNLLAILVATVNKHWVETRL